MRYIREIYSLDTRISSRKKEQVEEMSLNKRRRPLELKMILDVRGWGLTEIWKKT